MSSAWSSSSRGGRGAYASVAQTEDVNTELTAHGEETEDEERYVSFLLPLVSLFTNLEYHTDQST